MSTLYDPKIAVAGEGPPLVLVPGMDGTGLLFHRQVPLLARRYRTVTYTLRDDAATMDVLVDDVAAVIRTVGTGPAVVIGESFGGTVALSFALAHPELVGALVVLNSFSRFLPQVNLRIAIGALRVMPWHTMPLVRRLTAFRLHSRYTHRTEIRRFLELTRQTRRDGYIARLGILRRYDVRERLSTLRVPTLFLASELDHLIPSVREGRYMAERVSGATLRILAGHGHICLIAPNLDLEQLLREWRPDL
jgi:pimeloyl-ACP methyl ester carboxylesterase